MTLLSPFTDAGKAQRGQPSEEGERSPRRGVSPAPQILTSDPAPSPSPGQSLKGPWAWPGREAGAPSPALGKAQLGLSSSALGSVSCMQQ